MIHIAFCTDTNYVMPTGVAMISISENNQEEEITFHLVITDEGTSTDEVEKKVQPLLDIASKYGKHALIYSLKKEQLSAFECKGAGYISTTAFARIFLPDLLSLEISKVLYLDCDIACNGSLKELWKIELGDYAIAGVIDCNGTHAGYHERIKTPIEVPYINSGVLLMNLDKWRKENLIPKVCDCAIEHQFPLLDQDALNYYFQNKIKLLPVKYNSQTLFIFGGELQWHVDYIYLDEIRDAIKNPVIVHYLTANKPWNDAYCPHRDIWERYKNMSVWKDCNPKKILTRFDRTDVYNYMMSVYWQDGNLLIDGLKPYLRFFVAAVKLKNKSKLISISSTILNYGASLLEKLYSWKTRKQ